MGATTPAAFDPVLLAGHNTISLVCASAVLAGQVVAFNGTGVNLTIEPANGVTTIGPIGVAMETGATGDYIAVALPGAVLKVCEGAGSGVDAGDCLSVGGALGCVITTVDSADHYQVGVAIEDITANKTGYALLTAPAWVAKGA
jgi:hypothetical protein